jgi:Protein of unknown function (DUF2510)
MAVDTTRLRFGDMIAGASAVLLFLFTFLRWFKATGENGEEAPDALEDAFSFNAWEAMPILTFILLLCILAVIAVVAIRATGTQINLPVPLGTVILGAAALALLIILFRLLLTPDPEVSFLGQSANVKDEGGEIGRSYGIFLALLAALGMLAGGFLSARERGEAIPGVDGPVGGGGAGGGPLGTGQPAGGYGGQPAGSQPVGGAPVGGAPVGGAPGAASAGAADPGAGAGAAAAGGGGNPAPDWYDDPRGEARLRYWDGTQWTDQTAN